MINALILTIILEGSLGFLMGMRTRKKQLLMLLVNILTNPVAVFLSFVRGPFCYSQGALVNRIARIIPESIVGDTADFVARWGLQIGIELVVILVESWIYYKFSRLDDYQIKHPVGLAVACNLFSYGMGIVLQLFL